MVTKLRLAAAVAVSLLSAAAVALPPDHGGVGNVGVNPTVNGTEAMSACMATCQPHSASVQLCNNQCSKIVHQIGQPPPGAFQGMPPDATTCAILEVQAWGFYGTCSYLIAQVGGALSPAVGAALSGIVNASTASSLVKSAIGVADPCGYLRNQLIQSYESQGCPASTILPKLGIQVPFTPR